ncbi:MAG: hypothetical protein K9L30_09350 [Desulfobacterales bacterium]|nr:hypothetical protein [Desulfobacterales bacterium]
MKYDFENTINNKSGFLLVSAIFIMAILLIAGLAIVQMSSTEVKTSRSEQVIAMDFYNAEAGIIEAMDNYAVWLDNDYLLESIDAASFEDDVENMDNEVLAHVQIRNIYDPDSAVNDVFGSDDPADDFPFQEHIAPPPSESGFSMVEFDARRYAITSTAPDSNSKIQTGAYKVFNKF